MPDTEGNQTIAERLADGIRRGFKYDGCTGVPDFRFKTCCDLHDYDYQDLTKSKWKADSDFLVCMWKRKTIVDKVLAPVYYTGVTLFGWFYWKRKQNESIAKVGTPDEFAGGPG